MVEFDSIKNLYNMKPVLSLYTHTFKHEDAFYLYNAQTGLFCEITPYLYDLIQSGDFSNLPEDELKELMDKKIIVEEESKYDYFNLRMYRQMKKNFDSGFLSLVLMPTTGCNFACPYCFEPKKNPKNMSDEVIEDILKFVRSRKDSRSLSLVWYGGEPLMGLDKIEKILEGLSEEGLPKLVSHSIVTNGYLFTERAIEVFKKYPLNSIQITIDGSQEHHDRTRTLLNGAPTFAVIIRNLHKILEEMPNTAVSIRVNVNRENWYELLKLKEELDPLMEKHKNLSIYPGLIREPSDDGKSMCATSFTCYDVMDLYNLFAEKGVDISIFPRRTEKGCMMQCADSFLIGPEGEIYKCWNDVGMPEKVVGNISEPEKCQSSLYLKYLMTTSPFDAECRECPVFPICHGGCGSDRYKNLYEGGRYAVCTTFRNPDNLIRSLLRKDPMLMPNVES